MQRSSTTLESRLDLSKLLQRDRFIANMEASSNDFLPQHDAAYYLREAHEHPSRYMRLKNAVDARNAQVANWGNDREEVLKTINECPATQNNLKSPHRVNKTVRRAVSFGPFEDGSRVPEQVVRFNNESPPASLRKASTWRRMTAPFKNAKDSVKRRMHKTVDIAEQADSVEAMESAQEDDSFRSTCMERQPSKADLFLSKAKATLANMQRFETVDTNKEAVIPSSIHNQSVYYTKSTTDMQTHLDQTIKRTAPERAPIRTLLNEVQTPLPIAASFMKNKEHTSGGKVHEPTAFGTKTYAQLASSAISPGYVSRVPQPLPLYPLASAVKPKASLPPPAYNGPPRRQKRNRARNLAS